MTDLASIRARVAELAKKATLGPWQEDSGDVYDTRSDGAPGTPLVRADREYRRWGRDLTNDEREANSAYIAACDPQTILALCAEIDRLEALVGEVEAKWHKQASDDAKEILRFRAALDKGGGHD